MTRITVGIKTDRGNDIRIDENSSLIFAETNNYWDSGISMGEASRENIDNIIYCLEQLKTTLPPA